jgi:2-amino-4-hydroxy-6-hydroxymethyldihydropteridine diphosphokinase
MPPLALAAVPHQRAFVGMGGNLGNVQAHLASALVGLAGLPGTSVEAVSSLYKTRPVDAGGPDYLNAVVSVQSCLGALELLHALLALEMQHDRTRPFRHAPRTLDLDLLWYDGLTLDLAELTLPHPRMMQRAFVLVPLNEVLDGLPQDEDVTLRASLPTYDACRMLAQQQGIEVTDLAFGQPPG